MENDMSQVEQQICGICHEDVIDSRTGGTVATGSLKTSCGHLFHPNCLWKWYSTQDKNNCPMCRTPATEWERVREGEEVGGEEEAGDQGIEAGFDDGGLIRITRVAMEGLLRSQGGLGVTAGVEAELAFDIYGEITITRYEFARIMAEQGATALTDESWIQLMATFPAGDDLFGWEQEAVHLPGPFDIVEEPVEEPRVTFTRAQVENFLRAMGSSCTVTEFFNEEDGEEETLVVTMTHASLEARLSSIVGREVEYKGPAHVILNPEDELEV